MISVKRGDTRSIEMIVKDGRGKPVPMYGPGHTASFHMQHVHGGAAKTVVLAILDVEADTRTRGKARLDPTADFFEPPGNWRAEVEVIYPDGQRRTFPSGDEYEDVVVGVDLG